MGIEPTTTGLKVLRSTTELIGFMREMGFEPTTFGEIGLPTLLPTELLTLGASCGIRTHEALRIGS